MNSALDVLLDEGRAGGKRRVLLLDYDGTLVPFTSSPELAVPDEPLLSLLEVLSARLDTAVHVVSGRCRHTLDAWLGHLPIGLHAEHGYWTRRRPLDAWKARHAEDHAAWMERVSATISVHARAVPGSFIERKSAGLAWHYRNAEPRRAARARTALREALRPVCAEHGLGWLDGDCVVEVRQGRTNKGHVVKDVVLAHGPGHHFIAIGDDVTDEDMFAALPSDGVAIAAGPRASSPRHRLDGPQWVRRFLTRLCDAPSSSVRPVAERKSSCRT